MAPFDVTVAPLMHPGDWVRGEGRLPTDPELDEARACVGADLVALDE